MIEPLEFSQDDINRGKLVKPDWYGLSIEKVEKKQAKNGESINYVMHAKVISSKGGDGEFAGVPVVWNFNSKALGFMVGFVAALTGEEVKAGKRFDIFAASGKKIYAFIGNKEYEGNMRNNVEHKYAHYEE